MSVVAACTNGPAVDEYCLVNQPMRPRPETIDVMSDREITDMLEYNTYGARRCGWSKS